jgi:histidinol-phosphate aminotransferase
MTIAERSALVEGVTALGVEVAESDANFIWVVLPDAEDPGAAEAQAVKGLLDRGVLVRAGASLGRAGAMRVTVGTGPENERFVAALAELL